MIDQDKKAFEILMMGTGEVYNKQITKPLMRIYFNALQKFDINTVEQAFTAHICGTGNESTFFPKPADILRNIVGTKKDAEQDIEFRANIAWSVITDQIRRTGRYGSLKIDDKQAMAAVKAIGGWTNLCSLTEEQLVWKQKEFEKTYETYEKAPIESLPSNLPGLIELSKHKHNSVKSLADIRQKIISSGKLINN